MTKVLTRVREVLLANKRVYKRVLQVLVIGVVFSFLARNLYQNWNELSSYPWHINWYFLIISFFIMMINYFLVAFGWNLILRVLGGTLGLRKGLKIFFLAELGRYIPGKVWSMVGKVYLCKEQGIPVAKSSGSVVLQPLVQVVSGSLVFLVSLMFWTNIAWIGNLYVVLILVFLGLVLLHPSVIKRALNLALRIFRRNPVELSLRYKHTLGILLLWCGLWVLNGIAHYFLIISIYPMPVIQLLVIIGVFSISWVVAFLSLLTPSGLGVMEGTLTFLLAFYLPLPVATVIALLSRVWRTVTDLTCVAITSKF